MARAITIFSAQKILTMNAYQPVATHVAISEGRILGVGSLDDLAGWGTYTLDTRFADKTLLPGFVEAHCHAMNGSVWENTYVGIPFKVGTDEEVMASIDATLNGPSAGDYYNAAVYYLNSDKDISKAKEWMDKAMEMTETPMFWQLRQQSLILAKAGDIKGAIAAAKASLEGAKKAGNKDYIKMNEDALKEWGAK